LSTHLRLCLPSGLFRSGFPTNILHAFLFSQFGLHVLPISSSLPTVSDTLRNIAATDIRVCYCLVSLTTLLLSCIILSAEWLDDGD
jgi:hypothetical protein